MNTLLIVERPMIALPYQYSDGQEFEEEVYASDLKDSEPGDEFGVDFTVDSEAVRAERIKVIYKDEDGVAALLTSHEKSGEGIADFITKKAVVWFDFR